MERRTKARIAIVVSVLSLISMLVLTLIAFSTTLLQQFAFSISILFLLSLWLVATISAISYAEEGWTARGSDSEWILAAMFDPILTAFMFFQSKGEEKGDTGHDPVDLVEFKRKRMRWR